MYNIADSDVSSPAVRAYGTGTKGAQLGVASCVCASVIIAQSMQIDQQTLPNCMHCTTQKPLAGVVVTRVYQVIITWYTCLAFVDQQDRLQWGHSTK